jgi:hypothetical protein
MKRAYLFVAFFFFLVIRNRIIWNQQRGLMSAINSPSTTSNDKAIGVKFICPLAVLINPHNTKIKLPNLEELLSYSNKSQARKADWI